MPPSEYEERPEMGVSGDGELGVGVEGDQVRKEEIEQQRCDDFGRNEVSRSIRILPGETKRV